MADNPSSQDKPASDAGAKPEADAGTKATASVEAGTNAPAEAGAKPERAAAPAPVGKAAPKGTPASGALAIEEAPPVGGVRGWMGSLFFAVPSWAVSMVVHAVVLLVLALITLPPPILDEG